MRELLQAFLDFIYPPKCLLCSAVGDWLCQSCRDGFPLPPPPTCERCGDPVSPGVACRRCAGSLRPLASAAHAAVYAGSARECVRMLKYDGKRLLARPLADAMAFRLRTRGDLQRCDVIVPVALHPRRLRQRGYNQSLWLAEELSALSGLPVVDALTRTRDTHTQVGLHASERESNIAGAFAAAPGLAGRNVLLLDDVTTTGATARDAARALLASGAASVHLLVFARDIRL